MIAIQRNGILKVYLRWYRMIKWMVKKYLENKLEFVAHQLLSLEVEIDYADNNMSVNEEADILMAYEGYRLDKQHLIYVIDNII
jgi:hypothetical protein